MSKCVFYFSLICLFCQISYAENPVFKIKINEIRAFQVPEDLLRAKYRLRVALTIPALEKSAKVLKTKADDLLNKIQAVNQRIKKELNFQAASKIMYDYDPLVADSFNRSRALSYKRKELEIPYDRIISELKTIQGLPDLKAQSEKFKILNLKKATKTISVEIPYKSFKSWEALANNLDVFSGFEVQVSLVKTGLLMQDIVMGSSTSPLMPEEVLRSDVQLNPLRISAKDYGQLQIKMALPAVVFPPALPKITNPEPPRCDLALKALGDSGYVLDKVTQ